MPLDDYPKEYQLKGNTQVVIRPLQNDDFDRLFAFFQAVPAEDRNYLRHDVSNPDIIRRWTSRLDLEHVIPLVALVGDEIVGDGTLHVTTHGWMQHVGHIRLVVCPDFRHLGLGTIITRELVAFAEERGLEKVQAHVIENNVGAVRMFRRLGFEKVLELKDMVKDQNGFNRNLAIMVNDVDQLSQIMEDWIQNNLIPAYRVPGAVM